MPILFLFGLCQFQPSSLNCVIYKLALSIRRTIYYLVITNLGITIHLFFHLWSYSVWFYLIYTSFNRLVNLVIYKLTLSIKHTSDHYCLPFIKILNTIELLLIQELETIQWFFHFWIVCVRFYLVYAIFNRL